MTQTKRYDINSAFKINKSLKNKSGMTDSVIARKYINKIEHAKTTKTEFTLSLMGFMNLIKAKKCYYTKLPLTVDTITLDRVDSSKGYIPGNVVACHTTFNSLKSMIEGNNALEFKSSLRGLNLAVKLLNKGK